MSAGHTAMPHRHVEGTGNLFPRVILSEAKDQFPGHRLGPLVTE